MISNFSKTSLLIISLSTTFPTLSGTSKHHFPGVFVGYTHIQSNTEFTYGVEYEYKFNPTWGLGFVYEKIDDAHHGDGVDIQVAEIFYHPSNHIRLGIGAGKEKIGGHHPHSEDLIRLSASYEYHIGKLGVEPTIATDFVGSETSYVLGVAFILPF